MVGVFVMLIDPSSYYYYGASKLLSFVILCRINIVSKVLFVIYSYILYYLDTVI